MNKSLNKALEEGTIEERIANMKRHRAEVDAKITEYEKALEERNRSKIAIPFMPKNGEVFYLYYNKGCIQKFVYDSDDNFQQELIATTACFHTEAEAKLAYEKHQAEVELSMLCGGDTNKNGSHIWNIIFNRRDKKWEKYRWFSYTVCPYCFASEESCQAAIDKLGDRKLRLIFNIPLED